MKFSWIFLMVFIPSLAFAEIVPSSYPSDSHIKLVTYSPNQVYRVNGLQGYTTAIELGPDENIISVNIGDSSAWLVNVQNNIINLKPVTSNPNTNMNVVSSRGTYQFFLTAPNTIGNVAKEPNRSTVFLLRFRYPDLTP
ncbi:MAG TPA: TrbG/VirB9 family P-type conjugative transfer protein, partial [Coxiellaceae bacterium]|nr:TrbG/VirB9 family P-type conjugative transfer protein [Coxiellaceae bacterium]